MTTYKEIFGKPIKSLTGDPAPTPITYTVTVSDPGSGNVYYIDGVQTPTLELYEGNTYNFDYSAATGHPFRFATAADAAGSTEYTTGVSVDSNITTIVVASGAPNLFYYCTNHNGMGGRALTPASPDEYTGQIWYNETTGKFRSVVAGGAWSSTSPLNTAISYAYTGGTQNAAFSAAGAPGPKVQTEEYNGSGWSIGNNVGTARYEGGSAGTLTAGLMYGGYEGPPAPSPYPKAQTEEYDGTSWSEQNDLNTSRYSQGGFGTQTAAVYTNGGNPVADTEEYNGTSWSEGNNSTTNRFDVGTAGILTAGMIFGGQQPTPAVLSATELYDGTNWTNGPSLNNQRSQLGGSGIQTSALAFGGRYYPSPPVRAFTEQFDGTSWSEVGDLATARRQLSSPRASSSNASSLAIGGSGPGNLAITEEWNFTVNTVTAGAWASGGNMVNSLRTRAGSGIQTAALAAGGEAPRVGDTEEYDGTSWSEQNNMNTARNQLAAAGTQTATIVFGGETPSSTANAVETESYNGTSWSEVNDLGTGRRDFSGMGTSTAAVAVGGFTPPGVSTFSALVEKWDGTNWTAAPNALPTATASTTAWGTQTAGLVAGGYVPGTVGLTTTFEYDGTNWTSGGAMNVARAFSASGNGSQTAALITGGSTPPTGELTSSEHYDGSSWSSRPSISTARTQSNGLQSTSGATAGLIGGGYTGTADSNATEEFTPETTSLNYKNISSS